MDQQGDLKFSVMCSTSLVRKLNVCYTQENEGIRRIVYW